MHKHSFRVFILVLIAILVLAGQAAVMAQSGVDTSHSGYALGAHDPNEQVGPSTYPSTATAPSTLRKRREP